MRAVTERARRIREHVLRMVHAADASHVGSCLSCVEVLAVLYSGALRVRPEEPDWTERDRFVMSKGHAAAALYATLADAGLFDVRELATYGGDGTRLVGHVAAVVPGVEVSTGSLGHGLPVACGMALAAQRGSLAWRTVVLASDGECDEGSTWEAALFAAHHSLGNLTVVIDANGIQSFGRVDDVLRLEPLVEKWISFGWEATEVDGHDVAALDAALRHVGERPRCVIARTVKGKGVSFMENDLAWHYRSPSDAELADALAEVRA